MRIIDTTLREGEQTPGVSFDLRTKKRIIDGLVGLRVDEIEIGIANPKSQGLAELADYIRVKHPGQFFSLWCRCLDEDIYFAASLRPHVLSLSIPASDLHLEKKLGRDRNWAVRRVVKACRFAGKLGIRKIALGLEDGSRAEPQFIKTLAKSAKEAGAFRLRLADTVGIANPADIIKLLSPLSKTGLELGIHCHNDFGMATANTITALEHGAIWADVTILGLGERAGNSRLEEVVSFLALKKKQSYRLGGLASLCAYVARQARRKIGPAKAILGSEIFTCETGLHIQGLLADPITYEPFAPEQLGRTRKIVIGQKAGRRSIAATLGRLNFRALDDSTLSLLTCKVRTLATSQRRALSDQEIVKLASMMG